MLLWIDLMRLLVQYKRRTLVECRLGNPSEDDSVPSQQLTFGENSKA